jgi:hypothetical protein
MQGAMCYVDRLGGQGRSLYYGSHSGGAGWRNMRRRCVQGRGSGREVKRTEQNRAGRIDIASFVRVQERCPGTSGSELWLQCGRGTGLEVAYVFAWAGGRIRCF